MNKAPLLLFLSTKKIHNPSWLLYIQGVSFLQVIRKSSQTIQANINEYFTKNQTMTSIRRVINKLQHQSLQMSVQLSSSIAPCMEQASLLQLSAIMVLKVIQPSQCSSPIISQSIRITSYFSYRMKSHQYYSSSFQTSLRTNRLNLPLLTTLLALTKQCR